MENNELKKVRIKNHTCYYFNDSVNLEDFNLDSILTDKKSHENIPIYDISYKTLISSKPLRIRFYKIDGIVRIYDGTRYLTLASTIKISRYFSHYFVKIKVDSYNSLLIEKTLTLYNVIIFIKSVVNNDKNHYYD